MESLIPTFSHIYSLNKIKAKQVGDGQHGTARWATMDEIKKTYAQVLFTPKLWRKGKNLPDKQGIVTGCISKRKKTIALVDTADVHAMMIGAAGVGKTAYWLYPNIEYACASGVSWLNTDTKGDVARNYGLSQRSAMVITFLLSTFATRRAQTATIERPLMTPDELKSMPKGQFIVMKTGAYPMKVQLKLFFEWGIEFLEPYRTEEKAGRKVAYASREKLIENVRKRYEEKSEEVPAQEHGIPPREQKSVPSVSDEFPSAGANDIYFSEAKRIPVASNVGKGFRLDSDASGKETERTRDIWNTDNLTEGKDTDKPAEQPAASESTDKLLPIPQEALPTDDLSEIINNMYASMPDSAEKKDGDDK